MENKNIPESIKWVFTIKDNGIYKARLVGENKEIIKVVSKLKHKYKVSTDKTASKIIGINIIKTNKGYKINQKDYIEKMLTII